MSEKTEKATPQKLRQARKKGQVAKSAEFTGYCVLLTASLTLYLSLELWISRLASYLKATIDTAMREPDIDVVLDGVMTQALMQIAALTGILLALIVIVAAFIAYIQVGSLFSLKPILPDSSRLDPMKGLKQMVSRDKFVELLKNSLKIVILLGVSYLVLKTKIHAIIQTPNTELGGSMALFFELLWTVGGWMVGVTGVFACFDFWWQRFIFQKDQRMSKHDIKQEYKSSEGDPQHKAVRQQFHRDLTAGGSIRQVKDADAVIVNPTHIAVAISYRRKEMQAPKILTSGEGELAHEMRRLARRHNIPIIKNITLARALFKLDAEQYIPQELYEPVAEVLRFVYRLRQR